MWRLRTRAGFFLALTLLFIIGAWALYSTITPDTTHPAPTAATPAITPVAKPPRKAANETDRLILALFDSELDGSGLAFEQQLRTRYRNAYIGIYLLKGCNIDVTRYHNALARTLAGEWQKQGHTTPPSQDITSMLNAIIEEARSSYTMLYVDTPCEKRNLPAFTDYFDKLTP